MSFCRTKSVRMQGLLPMAADVDQIRGRSAACDQFQTKKRMMALSAYTWPSDSKYWPVYDVISVVEVVGTFLRVVGYATGASRLWHGVSGGDGRMLVAGACNAPNALVVPFQIELLRPAA